MPEFEELVRVWLFNAKELRLHSVQRGTKKSYDECLRELTQGFSLHTEQDGLQLWVHASEGEQAFIIGKGEIEVDEDEDENPITETHTCYAQVWGTSFM